MNKAKDTSSVGRDLVQRLKRFTEGLENTDDIDKRFTCRTVKVSLRPTTYDALAVKRIRSELHASQAVFAQFLGVSLSAVRDWEQGLKSPSGAACRMMDEIACNPSYFLGRLKQLSSAASA